MKTTLLVSLALALSAPLFALSQTAPASPADIQGLRAEIDAMRASYEARLQALEERLVAAERVAQTATTTRPEPTPAGVATVAANPGTSGSSNAFNPAIALILSGGYTHTAKDPATFRISGFPLPQGSEAGPGGRGFNLGESELGLSANIDPWWRGAAQIALHADERVSVEEAYVQTTALGHGLSLKAGRFLSSIGYLNEKHAHTWDFADQPLAYQAMLGTQFGDDGIQLKWLAPTERYLELGLELGRGRSYPGGDNGRNGAGMAAMSIHTGGDFGISHDWRAGLSLLHTRATDQALDAVDATGSMVRNAFSGRTRVWVIDGVWKWAPDGNATRTSFKLQGEYLHSTRTGSLSYDTSGVNIADASRSAQSGWYLQAIYQFLPGWRLGLRTERLNAGTPDHGVNTAALATGNYQPGKNTLMLDYSPSEFSRLRLQFARDRSRQGLVDNQVFLTYQMSLGAHGAHAY